MKLSKLLNNFLLINVLSLIFLFFSITPISSAGINPCDNPETQEIESCSVECTDASTCGCQQSAACIDGVCSCTVDGIGFPDEYCSDCVDNYQSCSRDGGGLFEIRWCGGGSGPTTCNNPSNLPDAVLSCDGRPGSFNQTQGFVYKLT